MKHIILLSALSALTLGAWAQDSAASAKDTTPWDYIMMKHGRLIEVAKGRRTPVKRNVVLVDETTIRPNGTINDSNGKTKKLKNGQYITMDGRIRKLKDMATTIHP